MAKKKIKRTTRADSRKPSNTHSSSSPTSKIQNRFHLEFLNNAQRDAWSSFDKHDVLFLLGPAGCGKSHLACAFAINEILAKKKEKIVLTRPIIEAGEALGFLPGTMDEKVHPYMLPMYDCISRTVGREGPQREMIDKSLELAPIAYMRGRSLLNSEILITPNGLKTMGEVKVGDSVIGVNGKPVKVVGVYPQGVIPYVKISFSDGTRSLCSWDHLWATWTTADRIEGLSYSIKSTKEISDNLFDEAGNPNHEIPLLRDFVKFEPQKVEVDPYTLGVLLSSCSNFYNPKIDSVKHSVVKNCLKSSDEISFSCLKDGGYKLFLGNLEKRLDDLNLLETTLSQRFIPLSYKINSELIRLELLRGIMDACGIVSSELSVTFKSEQLSEDFLFLVRSLGGYGEKKVVITKKANLEVIEYQVIFSLDLSPFKIKSKSKQFKRTENVFPRKMIVGIEPVGEGLCTCITVDDVDHLFATNDFILTHNTFNDAVCIFDEAQNATKTQLKLFLTRFGQNSKVIITGDPKQSDLRLSDQSLMNVVQSLEDLPGIGVIYFDAESIVRHPLIASIIERLEDKKTN